MTENEQERFEQAKVFAAAKHEGQFRIGGLPYITHPVEVARMIRDGGGDIDAQITALFHDLLEDTDATPEEILRYGNSRILHSVNLLTKKKDYVMEEYISAIKRDDTAFAVKAADRLHNLLCAESASDEFKRKYIRETVEWYLDFSPDILPAVKRLEQSMQAEPAGKA